MLADNVSYFNEDFLAVDITDDEILTDTDVAAFGPLVSVDRKGRVTRPQNRAKGRYINKAVEYAVDNYRKGAISAESVAEYALSQLIETEAS